MAIEIKPHRTAISVLKTQPQSINGNAEKSDFAVTLSETRNVERRAVERKDSVVITNALTQMRKSFASESGGVDVDRLAKLARIRDEIANGTYKIDPDRIAAKMMNYAY